MWWRRERNDHVDFLKLECGYLCKQVARYAFVSVDVNAYLKKVFVFTGCMTAPGFLFLITARLRAFPPDTHSPPNTVPMEWCDCG